MLINRSDFNLIPTANIFDWQQNPALYALYQSFLDTGVIVSTIELKRFTGRIQDFEFYNNDANVYCMTLKFYVNNNDSYTRDQTLITVGYNGQNITLCGTRVPALQSEVSAKFQHNKYFEPSLFKTIFDNNGASNINYLSMIYLKITTA